jgi:hypothetical protein
LVLIEPSSQQLHKVQTLEKRSCLIKTCYKSRCIPHIQHPYILHHRSHQIKSALRVVWHLICSRPQQDSGYTPSSPNPGIDWQHGTCTSLRAENQQEDKEFRSTVVVSTTTNTPSYLPGQSRGEIQDRGIFPAQLSPSIKITRNSRVIRPEALVTGIGEEGFHF